MKYFLLLVCFLITLIQISEISSTSNNLRETLSRLAKKKKTKTKKQLADDQTHLNYVDFDMLNHEIYKRKGKTINSLGLKSEIPTVLDKKPFNITSCDQIVEFPTSYIPDREDYTKRAKCHIVMTAYYTHLFDDKEKKRLIGSVLHTLSKQFPSEPRGAENCLKIDGGDFADPIIICLDNTKDMEEIQTVLRRFTQCRANRDVEPLEDISFKILKSCSPVGIANPKDIFERINKLSRPKPVEGFFSPGDGRVPGTRPEESNE